jgi:hypothetical protein
MKLVEYYADLRSRILFKYLGKKNILRRAIRLKPLK